MGGHYQQAPLWWKVATLRVSQKGHIACHNPDRSSYVVLFAKGILTALKQHGTTNLAWLLTTYSIAMIWWLVVSNKIIIEHVRIHTFVTDTFASLINISGLENCNGSV